VSVARTRLDVKWTRDGLPHLSTTNSHVYTQSDRSLSAHTETKVERRLTQSAIMCSAHVQYSIPTSAWDLVYVHILFGRIYTWIYCRRCSCRFACVRCHAFFLKKISHIKKPNAESSNMIRLMHQTDALSSKLQLGFLYHLAFCYLALLT